MLPGWAGHRLSCIIARARMLLQQRRWRVHQSGILAKNSFNVRPVLDGYGSTFFNMSPGWHSSASQMAASVENRTARTLPVLIRDRFTLVIPTRCDSLLSDTPRSSMISSSSMTMAMSVYPSTLRPDHDTTSCSKCSLKMMHPASVHARTWAHVHDKGAIRVEDQGSARRARLSNAASPR